MLININDIMIIYSFFFILLLPNRTAPIKEEEMRKDIGGVVVPVHGHIPILIHIPAHRGGTLDLVLDTITEDLGLAPYPVHSTSGLGPGMKE